MTETAGAESSNPTSANTRRVSAFRKAAAGVVLVAAVAGTAAYKYDEANRPRIISGPMIQAPTADSVSVIWTAQSPFDEGAVTLVAPDGEKTELRVRPSEGRYVATFDKLTKGARYDYTIANAGFLSSHAAESGPHAFRVTPGRDESARILAFGDSGVGSNTQQILARVMAAQKPDVVVHTGDLIYPAGAEKDYPPNFYRPYSDLIATSFFLPTLGNHDVASDKGAPLLAQFILPENGPPGVEAERNFWFDWGPARIVGLDTNLDAHGGVISHDQMKTDVATWLRETLTDCDATWRIVYFHHPFYTGSAHSAEGSAFVKEAFLDVFEAAGVDLVLCGHNHLYERTAPMRQDRIVPLGEGIIYVTTGAGGAQRYPEGENPPDYIVRYDDGQFSFSKIDLSPSTLSFAQLGEDGQAIDTFELTRSTR
ncbi:MAG TPA: metallophosphoesterase [Phycisphaerae bacterium]|nr:metallophosphoesterase [Phycisphaerae bacterium]HRW54934.1 metallophosphoesterase [Phycisphaerae bacterium]